MKPKFSPELKEKSVQLHRLLQNYPGNFAQVIPVNFESDPYFWIDLSVNNPEMKSLHLTYLPDCTAYIFGKMAESRAKVALGGYAEDRAWYRQSQVFHNESNVRSIHLGIDLWMEAGSEVYAPLEGQIHSWNDNAGFGNYGPTLLLEHQMEEITFYSLYGHLSRRSLEGLYKGKSISKGEKIAELGETTENGQWPPHLHFQLMIDLLGNEGDFYGVASEEEKDFYLMLCPDPNLILRVK